MGFNSGFKGLNIVKGKAADYSERYTKYINLQCEQNLELLNVKTEST